MCPIHYLLTTQAVLTVPITGTFPNLFLRNNPSNISYRLLCISCVLYMTLYIIEHTIFYFGTPHWWTTHHHLLLLALIVVVSSLSCQPLSTKPHTHKNLICQQTFFLCIVSSLFFFCFAPVPQNQAKQSKKQTLS